MDELDGLEDEGGGRGESVGRHGQEEKKEFNKKRVNEVEKKTDIILIVVPSSFSVLKPFVLAVLCATAPMRIYELTSSQPILLLI